MRFAVGHAVLLALGAGLVLFFGWQIPVRFEQGGEFVGGCLLIALGLVVGWLTVSGRLYVHSHVHEAGEHGAHRHWHLHFCGAASIRIGRRFTPCCRACSARCSR